MGVHEDAGVELGISRPLRLFHLHRVDLAVELAVVMLRTVVVLRNLSFAILRHRARVRGLGARLLRGVDLDADFRIRKNESNIKKLAKYRSAKAGRSIK